MDWTQEDAISLCCQLEILAPAFGAHVALTGGTLYKDGERKDVDILFYRIRQVDSINISGLLTAMRASLGIVTLRDCGWVIKALVDNKNIDFFFPERPEAELAEAAARAGFKEYGR